ncbi:MAG: tripartite tricarboxylate transporter TctB family protein [Lachnospiraceae bacterium]|nr:tripartite tricarboxylate transporter TctB family protein [Lachnospiraceae bacterium]
MFLKKYGDIMVGLFFMAISAIMMGMAMALPKSKVMDIGPDFMPMVIGSVTFVLAAVLTFLNVKNYRLHAAELKNVTIESCDYKRVLSSMILVLIYVFTMKPIGFLISTLVYLPLQMLVLAPDGQRDKKHVIQLIVINVLFTLIVFFLFRYGFKIVLPAGIFTITL